MPSTKQSSSPFAEAVDQYVAAGWIGVLPVGNGPRQKAEPPKGFTGHQGRWPTPPELAEWKVRRADRNVALRLEPGIVGIDVDAYGDKPGAQTLAAAEAAHGSLPATWVSSSRSAPSGIRFYSAPYRQYPGELTDPATGKSGIEIIQHSHRYAVVWPSVHPDTGQTYRMTAPDGSEGSIPSPGDLPRLPPAWVDHLAGTCACYANAGIRVSSGDAVADRLADAMRGLASGSRHPGILKPTLALVGFANRGSQDAERALRTIHDAFVAAITAPGDHQRTPRGAEAEWDRMTTKGKAASAGAGEPAWDEPAAPAGGAEDPSGDTPPDARATLRPPPLARSEDILDAVAATVARLGVAGESRVVKLIYLVVVTRLLDRIVSLAVKGPSSAGKSFLVEVVLRLFPESACHVLSAFSERALIYDDAPLEHRMLVIYEAAGMAGDVQTYIVRSLLSEGHVRYITVEKGKGGLKPRTIDRKGPTGLITTTTEIKLHPENETRLLSVTVSDTSAQTKAVLLAHASGTVPLDLQPWHQLQDWLAQGSNAVTIPYVVTLAENIPPVAVRLRRDFPAVVSLIKAHALLHQLSRERDDDGAVVATIEDYAVVRHLVADLVADAAERSVPESVRETVKHVGTLTLAGGETSLRAAAVAMGLDKSAASRRVRSALDRGFLKNLEDKRGRPSRLALGDPLPEEQIILPEPGDLEVLQCCSASQGGSNSEVGAWVSPTREGREQSVNTSVAAPAASVSVAAYITPPDDAATLQQSSAESPSATVTATLVAPTNGRPPTNGIDLDLAERATDDDGEAPICEVCGHVEVSAGPDRWVCTYAPGHQKPTTIPMMPEARA